MHAATQVDTGPADPDSARRPGSVPERALSRRRLGLGAHRALAMLPGAGLGRRCLFVHLPKCGGTSLTEGLAGCVPLLSRVGAVDAIATRRAAAAAAGAPGPWHEELGQAAPIFALREALALTHIAWGAPLVHGHLLLTPALATLAEAEGYGLVTMMRDPAERALSNFRMAVRAGILPDDLDAWLDGPVGARMGASALRYLSGSAEPPQDPGAALVTARAVLRRFAVVGCLEDPAAFRDAFARHFGARPAMPRRNRAPDPAPALDQVRRRRLDRLTEADRELYDLARALATPARASRRRPAIPARYRAP